MIADSHMHTSFSSDSDTPMEKMVEQAIALGMESICITDHYDKDYFNGGISTGYRCLSEKGL